MVKNRAEKRAELTVLPGCLGCNKVCNWRGSTADKARADDLGREKYNCNTAINDIHAQEVTKQWLERKLPKDPWAGKSKEARFMMTCAILGAAVQEARQ
jgi:hypothetical protein